ncbi:sad1 unc domain protein [Colletotrichum truncatum]|uniref:Sad1 unc domain protein n=1 Tax=Colletotrichum truncatum TaxID=5467 RepID=A0ACC3YI70_COLTU|nr:sad1 unc domain protein [Colletotrichum truncatum]KAF6794555.1 sad1 unc domain protein [Colletotrichum truncatum]
MSISLLNRLYVGIVVFGYLGGYSLSLSIDTPSSQHGVPSTGVCAYKTINYITHTLPQQCLKTSWPGNIALPHATDLIHDDVQSRENGTTHPVVGKITTIPDEAVDPVTSLTSTMSSKNTYSELEPTPRPFMSFEDWKEMMLRKAGQDPSEFKGRRPHDRAIEHERATKSSSLDSLGDDGEIDLNFDVVSEKISNIASAPQPSPTDAATSDPQEPVLYDDGRTQYYRSKDAGKTCKERFSYSSFDAGATVLKTNQGAKNAKAILVENKDSYMLLECSAENKFVIVELSDDILVDTVVLANFEFFSSMIRQFRVSVSDRYPVKADKWKDLGTFEAKNSRDIQPFLVPNPLIWAKYVRVEFLSHYGNEYYCPVSLLRVHGTRMLESLKDTETPADDEDAAVESTELAGVVDDASTIDSFDKRSDASRAPQEDFIKNVEHSFSVDPLQPGNLFRRLGRDNYNSTCPRTYTAVTTAPMKPPDLVGAQQRVQVESTRSNCNGKPSSRYLDSHPPEKRVASSSPAAANHPETSIASTMAASISVAAHQNNPPSDTRSAVAEEISGNSSPTKATSQASTQSRTKSNSTAAPASPTVQESFFKAVSKRLQLLEANMTWSLKYIEDQSRSLQEIQHLAERKQLSRIDVFLDSLNITVLSELRNVRQQYDQIWQSTVIALESQREQSQRETVALSSRLNILADEVVFQKRMAIVQAILLLSCLVLVIFSRAMTQPILTGSFDLGRSPGLDHALPGQPTARDPNSVHTPGYDNFGRSLGNVDCGDGRRPDSSSGPVHTSSVAPQRLLTPLSDTAHNRYPSDDARCTEAVTTSGFDQVAGNEPDTGYQTTLSTPTTPSPLEGEFLTGGAALSDHNYSIQDPDTLVEPIPDPLLDVGSGQRFPPQTRSIVPSTIRKPLPALPEYPA